MPKQKSSAQGARSEQGQSGGQQGRARAGEGQNLSVQPDRITPPSDLERNPGIGSSKGAFASGVDPELLAGDSTFEGDVANETSRQGRVNPRHLGRTNK
jgi:hypothetical protein